MTEEPSAKQTVDMLELARERKFDALESLWMQRLEADEANIEEFLRVAEYLIRRNFQEQAVLLLWSLVTAVAEKDDVSFALDVARRAACVAPEAEVLREELSNLYKKAHPDVPGVEGFITACGIRGTGPIEEAVWRLERCLALRPGSYVIHERSRRIGRVQEFRDGLYEIESERITQNLSLPDTLAQWEPLGRDDFRALLIYENDRLRAIAREEPVELLTMIVCCCKGKCDLKQIKALLVPAVISANDWSAWWGAVKVAMKRCPWIEVSGSATQPLFTLRTEEASYSQTLRKRFASAKPHEKVKMVLAYLAESEAGHEADEDLAGHLSVELLRLATETPLLSVALPALAAAKRIHARFPVAQDAAGQLAGKAKELSDTASVIAEMDDDLARLVLAAVRELLPERWPDIFADALPGCSLRMCDWIVRELKDAGHTERMRIALERCAAQPEAFPEAFAWVWRSLLGGSGEAAKDFDRVSITVSFLHLMNKLARLPRHAENREKARRVLARLRNIVGADDFRLLRVLIADSSVDSAGRLHEAIQSNEGLTPHVQGELILELRDRHPQKFLQKKELWEDDFLYTTAEGFARRQSELEKLVNVDMRRNGEAIGKAASLGDLRENWEYKSALEERDRLVERATRARAEIEHARIIQADMIEEDRVNVGATVRLRDVAGGAERTVTFLGPWDTDIERGVYFYLAPLSLRFMGKKVGERIRAAFGEVESEFEIVGIQKAI